jgi:trans-aconitate 2-methyltransferase
LRFEQRRIEELDGVWDLILSNAALHWVPGHRELFPRLMGMLRAGGQLVIQMPSNWEHPSQALLRDQGLEELGWSFEPPTLSLNEYGELLWRAGGGSLTIFEKLYCHEMPSSDEIAEWMRGTALVPYLERVDAARREGFFARYRERLRAHWPNRPVFFGFRRILIAATLGPSGAAGGAERSETTEK